MPVRSDRFEVMVPPMIAKQIRELAADMGTSYSKAILLLLIRGLATIKTDNDPLNKKPE